MFKTFSDFPMYSHADIFRLNPLNQFLIKKYPREEDNGFLARHWQAYLFATRILKDDTYLDKVAPIVATPEEFYKIPNPSISSCFNEWLEMFKKDTEKEIEDESNAIKNGGTYWINQ